MLVYMRTYPYPVPLFVFPRIQKMSKAGNISLRDKCEPANDPLNPMSF